jgi:carbamoyltransferase
MYILSINISHDSSTCLLQDGEIIFYQEFERKSKVKHNYLKDINSFTFYHSDDIKKYTNFVDYIIFCSFDSPNDEKIISLVLEQLKNTGLKWNNTLYNADNHHLYHASNAAFSSGFEECACLIIDGSGSRFKFAQENKILSREIESIYSFDYSNGLKEKFKHYSRLGAGLYEDFGIDKNGDCTLVFSDSISCGKLFNMFSHEMGYNRDGNDAGKIMGLSSYGKKVETYGNWFNNIFDIEITNNNAIVAISKTIGNLQPQDQRDILKTLQEETKKHTIHLIKKTLKICNTNNIVLSGGYFLNCVNNYHYLKQFPEVNFYVDPISYDGGISIGAAKLLWYELSQDKTVRKLHTLYL